MVYFRKKYIGTYKEERQAARVVAREAVREWGEWAAESDLLYGEGLLTEEEGREILEEVSKERVRKEKVRKQPQGVKRKTRGGRVKYEAWYGKEYLGTFGRAEEGECRVSGVCEGEGGEGVEGAQIEGDKAG